MSQVLPDKEKIINEMVQLTLCRSDFIEWILHSTNDDCEFRVYKMPKYIMVAIDRNPFNV